MREMEYCTAVRPNSPMFGNVYVCTWALDERPADLHLAQPNVPNVPVSKTCPCVPVPMATVIAYLLTVFSCADAAPFRLLELAASCMSSVFWR
jgi:hypothetical protein